MFYFVIESLTLSLLIILPLLGAVAFFTLAERKLMASIQRRVGPNVVGWFGLLQPIADGLKLIVKETIIPSRTNRFLFIAAPGLVFFFSLIPWAVIPFEKTAVFMDTSLSLLFIFTITSLGVYGVIFGGWASNSKYAFLGAVRSTVQIISYELTLGLILASISLLTGSFNLINIVLYQVNVWNMFTLAPLFLIFLLVILIETNRSPADLPESESELVAGYSVDYSAIGFAMFFLGEYSNMLIMSSLTVILFLGGWLPPTTLLLTLNPNFNLSLDNYYVSVFAIKIAFICFYFIWVRATVPRLRYDFLLNLGWKKLLPFTFAFFITLSSVLLSVQGLPLREFFIINLL